MFPSASPIVDYREELRKAKKTSYSYSTSSAKAQESPRPPSPPPASPRQQAPHDKPKKTRTRDSTHRPQSEEFYFSTSGPGGSHTTHIVNCGPGATVSNVGNNYSRSTVINGDRVTTFSDDGTSQTTWSSSTGATFQHFPPGGTRTSGFHFQGPRNVVINDDETWVQNADGTWTCYPKDRSGPFTASSPRMPQGHTRSRGGGNSGDRASRR